MRSYKYMKKFLVFLLTFSGIAFEKIQDIEKQTVAKNNFFSMRIDDIFDDLILSLELLEPKFLDSSKRTIDLTTDFIIGKNFDMEIIDLAIFDNKLFILEKFGISIFDLESWEPQFLQKMIGEDLSFFMKIEVEGLIVIYQSFLIWVYTIQDDYFPIKVSKIKTNEEILYVKIKQKKLIIVLFTSIHVYSLVDVDLGFMKHEQHFDFFKEFSTYLNILDLYANDQFLFILEESRGLMQFSFFPVRFKSILKVKGESVSGDGNSIFIDGTKELDLMTLHVFPHQLNSTCLALAVDSNFIYCYSDSFFLVQSRFLPIITSRENDYLLNFKVFQSQVFLAYSKSISVCQVQLSPLFIEGRAPSTVSDYQVEFKVTSFSSNLTESFTLSVQYSFSDIIIFILISFIAVFFLVFSCSWIWRLFKIVSTQPEPPVVIVTTEGVSSSERNFFSDRNFIRQK
jgi:hypothetical protein